MKKYVLKRLLYGLFCLLVVTAAVMLLIYTAINRNVIFQQDDTWNKKSNNEQRMYEYAQYKKYGYLDYVDYTSFLKQKYFDLYGDGYDKNPDFSADKKAISDPKNYKENASVQEFYKTYESKGWQIVYYEPVKFKSGKIKNGGNAYLVAVDDYPIYNRLWTYVKGFFSVETKSDVEDPELTDRYIRFEKDPYSGLFAIVGSGTQHKYLLYFDGRFPFIHQNFLHLNLGTSYTTYRGSEITEVITTPTGKMINSKQQYPNMIGTDQYEDTAIDFHSLTYNSAKPTAAEQEKFPDRYTSLGYHLSGLSMLENSFVIGIIAIFLGYLFGLPIGIYMSRNKDKLGDKIGTGFIVFFRAVPSLAYIFLFAAAGTKLLNLPYKFANAKVPVLAFVLPIISMAIPQTCSHMMWMRRYMIDQMNSDYVKFARAEGLSEKEIYRIHISRNALILIVHGIPGSVLFALTGAIITERVYSVPGVGNLLTTAITLHDNGVIVAVTVFYTTLGILATLLGDLLLAKYDPRISLSAEGGGGR